MNLNYILIKTEGIPSVHLVFLASVCVINLKRTPGNQRRSENIKWGRRRLEPYELQLPLVGGSSTMTQGCQQI
jgi:hypothetical protein